MTRGTLWFRVAKVCSHVPTRGFVCRSPPPLPRGSCPCRGSSGCPAPTSCPSAPSAGSSWRRCSGYRAAGSPALREIEEWIRANDDLKGTASTETIRRILRGHVPPRWSTVEAIALAFFAMSDLEPGEERFSENMGDQFTNMDATRQAWADAIEEDPAAPDPHA